MTTMAVALDRNLFLAYYNVIVAGNEFISFVTMREKGVQ